MGQIQKVADPKSRVNLPKDRGSKTEWHSEGHMGLVVTSGPDRARMVVWFEG